MNLTQIKSAVSKLIGQDLSTLSEAELAQRLDDEAAKVTTEATVDKLETVEAVAVVETAVETAPVENTDNSMSTETSDAIAAIESRIGGLESTVQSFTKLVESQDAVIANLTSQIKTLNSLNAVLTNKVVALNVASTTAENETNQPVDAVTKSISKAEDKVVTMNMSDFIHGVKSSK